MWLLSDLRLLQLSFASRFRHKPAWPGWGKKTMLTFGLTKKPPGKCSLFPVADQKIVVWEVIPISIGGVTLPVSAFESSYKWCVQTWFIDMSVKRKQPCQSYTLCVRPRPAPYEVWWLYNQVMKRTEVITVTAAGWPCQANLNTGHIRRLSICVRQISASVGASLNTSLLILQKQEMKSCSRCSSSY